MIPVGNLYYLLCYAWNKLDESELIDVNALPRQDLPNLLGRILVGGVTRLLRQGVDRAYIESSEITHGPKGKIDLAFTVKTGSLDRNAVRCQIDALDQNILHNQIIKTILHRLTAAQEVDASLRSSMRVLAQHLNSVSAIGLRNQDFKRVQLHRNNSFYRFLLNVCELCHLCLLPDQCQGQYRFRDFLRDEVRMRKVFQDFVYNFYRIEQRSFSVSSQRISWDTDYVNDRARALLPEMITDVCLEGSSRKIVIECKYSVHTLQENWGKVSARSEHLYQLFSYLKQLEAKGSTNAQCQGLLLYPTVSEPVDFMFRTQGHLIRVFTLDLRRKWHEIRDQLLDLIEPWPTSIMEAGGSYASLPGSAMAADHGDITSLMP